MPLISVLMPAYQAELTIRQAIASVQRQTFQDWELIVIDDGCTDATVAITQDLMLTDTRIHLLQPGRQGVLGRVRQTGLLQARGKYVNFLDSDDLLEPDALANLFNHLQTHPECRLVYGQFGMINPDGTPFSTQPKGIKWTGQGFMVEALVQPSWASMLTSQTHNAVQSVLLRKTDALACGGFPLDKAINCCDYVFFVRIAKWAGMDAIQALPKVVFQYRQMPNSLSYGSTDKLKQQIDTVKPMMQDLYTDPVPLPMKPLQSIATAEQYAQWMRSAARKKSWTALHYAVNTLWQHPHITVKHKLKTTAKACAFAFKALIKL